MGKTRVFISSTCYDLSQIRKDLKEGIQAMGHIPILSENKDFPVSPELTSMENCINAVRNESDIFVLIIGNRYGAKLDSGKSITNTEFVTAYSQKIPVYTFTLKQVVHVLPTWRRNPDADFSDVVDDNKVFEFVDEVRNKKGLWNFEFESAQDILEILKSQWSILFQQALSQRQKFLELDNSLLSNLSNGAIKLLIEKPAGYETLVFLQMMQDEIGKHKYKKNDCDYSIAIKVGLSITELAPFVEWQYEQLSQVEKIIDNLNRLFDAFQHFFGEPGTPADIGGLYYVAKRYGELYAFLVQWVIDVRSICTLEPYEETVRALSDIPLRAISQLEAFPSDTMNSVHDAITRLNSGDLAGCSPVILNLHLSVDDKAVEKHKTALKALVESFSN